MQGLASGGGPNPDPGDAPAGDAAARQLPGDQLMRRPVLDSTRREADYGYSELDYYTAAGGSSTPLPATQTVPNTVTNVSAGNQDQGGYELIGPGSSSCGRNNADDAQSAAATPVPEEEFAARPRVSGCHLPATHYGTSVPCENDKPTGPGAQIYANSKFADTVLQSRQEKNCTGNFTLQQSSHPTCASLSNYFPNCYTKSGTTRFT